MSPNFSVVAGPNGSGKSTLTAGNIGTPGLQHVLDPDAIAKMIANQYEGDTALEAGRRVLKQVDIFIAQQTSFSVETTLSGKWVLSAMQKARDSGFTVWLLFVGLPSVEDNIQRVRRRVMLGGHSVPEQDIRRRYTRSFKNLELAIPLADQTLLIDNSSEQGFRALAHISSKENIWSSDLPEWARLIRSKLFPDR